MKDDDGDDYGDDTPPMGVTFGTDCDDADAFFNPDTAWHPTSAPSLSNNSNETIRRTRHP